MEFSSILNSTAIPFIISLIAGLVVMWIQMNYFISFSFAPKNKLLDIMINNNWEGEGIQDTKIDREIVQMTASVTFRKARFSSKKIVGKAVYSAINRKDLENINLDLKGVFIDDDKLELKYLDSNSAIKRFGNIFMEFNHNRTEIQSYFIGYGPKSKSLVSGEFLLKKK